MVFDAVQKLLIRMARQVLENVLNQLMQQFNIVQEMAMTPLRTMIQQVTDGMWRGQGANAFVEEVSNLVIPGVGKVGQHITTMHSNLNFAKDTIDHADEEVSRLVKSQIFDSFGFY